MGGRGGRPLGLGPVFAYEWITSTRRWQGYALRSSFVLALLVALTVVWRGRMRGLDETSLRDLARLGESFYLGVTGTQLTLVLLAAPAATAGAICLDRARGTLAHLLVTDLTDREIVLGKLAARLVPVLGLVGGTLPVLAILTLMGGVDPDALLAATAVTLGVAALGCGLALAFSLWAGKTHEALLGTYAVWGLWLLAVPILTRLNGVTGLSLPVPPRESDPFYLAFAPYWYPGRVGWNEYLGFLGATWAASALIAAAAVVRLRPVALRDGGPRPGLSPRVARRAAELARALDPTRRLPGPSLDGNPVFWREWHRNRPSPWARAVVGGYVMLAAAFSVLAVASGSWMLAVFVNGLQVSVGLLILGVTASTSLAEERVRGSLDVLMTTPMTTRQIVFGKWLGSFRAAPLLAVLPCAVVLGCGRGGAWRWAGAALMAVYVVGCGAAVTSLGLASATWCPRLGRAVGLTVAAYVLVTVGWLFLVIATMSPEPYGISVISASPFYGPVAVTVESCRPTERGSHSLAVFLWGVAYAAVAAVLLASTLAGFNTCLGRVETGLAWYGRRGRRRLNRGRVEPVAGLKYGEW